MVSMEEAEKIAKEFVKKKRNPIRPVDITSVSPDLANPKGWTVRGTYVLKIGMQNWVFMFKLEIDEKGKITSYNL